MFSFPGRTKPVHSLSNDLSATYKQGVAPGGSSDQYTFVVLNASGASLIKLDFTRTVEGAWSPYSDELYLNDFLGSTQIDCFVWNPQDKRLLSLTESLIKDPSSGPVEGRGAKPPETPENSRFELTCEGWRAKDKILVSVEGNTWAGGQFTYKLIYDLQMRRFTWE